MSGKRLAYWVGLPILPMAFVIGLWLASGRPVFTQHKRVVPVTVKDPFFGDTIVEQHFVPGPILGYFVGLDLVLAVAILSAVITLAVAFALRLLARHRAAGRETRDTHEGVPNS
jgi:hypothetical protein